MLKMANMELIRKLHLKEGQSIRQLSKDLKLLRQTIRAESGSDPEIHFINSPAKLIKYPPCSPIICLFV